MNKHVYVLTGYNHFFGQTRKPWVSMDTDLLIKNLKVHFPLVTEIPFNQVANNKLVVKDSIIFYTFSQRDNLRQYIKDVIYHLIQNGNLVFPRFELLLCHENKGFQELCKLRHNISGLDYHYFSSKRELIDADVNYPIVLKSLNGACSKGVFLVYNLKDIKKCIKSLEKPVGMLQHLDFFRRKYIRKKKFPGYDNYSMRQDYMLYRDYIVPEIGFVLQEFMPGLTYDYRVAIFGDRYFVSKRMVRDKDFRASGSKNFLFDFNAPIALLDYSREVFNKLDNPTMALDIGEKNGKFYLFEFMAISFGINTILQANHCYRSTNEGWSKTEAGISPEALLADSLYYYLDKQHLLER
jgi:glutathione synthase/RimK-type ligase-like ATP-grasp enzyme